MKKTLLALFLTAFAVDSFAVAPPGLVNYQGVLRNALNAPQNGTFDMQFAFYDDADPDCGDGTLLLTDSHLAAGTGDVTVTGGLFNTALGGGALTAGVESTLAAVFGNHTSVFLEVRVEGGGGGLETLCPRIRVVSAGYSLSADNLDGLDSTNFINTTNAAQSKSGQLGVGSLNVTSGGTTLFGSNINFADGAVIGAFAGGLQVLVGNDLTDDFTLKLGASVSDGGISIVGGGDFGLYSPAGTFRFVEAGTERAHLTAGDLQIDGDLDVDGNNISFGELGAGIAVTPGLTFVTGGDAASDDLVLKASASGADGQIFINGAGTMTLTAGNGLFSLVDGASGLQRATIDAIGNLQIDGILDDDLAISIGNGTVATVTSNPGVFTIGGTNMDLNLGDSAGDGVDVVGSFSVTGTKSFVQNHPYEKNLSIYYVALEGDEAGTYTRGSGRVLNGVARVPLGESFAWVTNPDIGLTAQVTPRGEWADLYVESVTPKEIVVRSRDASVPAAFDFIVYGLRIGHEDFPVVRTKTGEATVPSETAYARKYYANRPDLRAYSALARFQRMEDEAGVAHRGAAASQALRQAIGAHDLNDELATAQGLVEAAAAAAPVATADGASRKQSSSGEAGANPSVAGPSATANSLLVDAEANVDARSLRLSAEQLASLVEVAEPVEAGDVLVIDAERPGVMSLARTAADSAVFGVVAAEPEAILGAARPRETAPVAEGGEMAAQVSVALSGIVLCKVDARFGPIRAGDLLTTSATAGHAMRAQNPRPGTIIGKALEPLVSGSARIKVLVMLH